MTTGRVFNLQKYSVHDGPGIRTTIFLKGCPLHCAWCHNPESIAAAPELIVVDSRCLGCQQCRRACPQSEDDPSSVALPLAGETCLLCGACVDACPTGARQIVGREMTVSQVLESVLEDRIFYESSGGGVTFSGGEPLAQPDFLLALLTAARAAELHTAVDTCGLARWEHVAAIAPLTSLFLYDVKFMDAAKHQQYTGASNRLIQENLRALAEIHPQIWLRVPVIPGVNDFADDLAAVASLAASLPSVRQINLLPYHRIGRHKAAHADAASPVADVQPPSPEAMRSAAALFQKHGLVVKIGG